MLSTLQPLYFYCKTLSLELNPHFENTNYEFALRFMSTVQIKEGP